MEADDPDRERKQLAALFGIVSHKNVPTRQGPPMHEMRQRRPGYHRPRLLPEPESFTLGGHRFETDGKDLWVTLPEDQRIDRIKATRFVSSRSMKDGYPRELVRPDPMTPEFQDGSCVLACLVANRRLRPLRRARAHRCLIYACSWI